MPKKDKTITEIEKSQLDPIESTKDNYWLKPTFESIYKNILLIVSTSIFVVIFIQIFPPLNRLDLARSEIQNIIETNYIGEIPSNQILIDGQLRGYVATLEDPYSEYMTEDDNSSFENSLNERYDGIGIRFDKSEQNIVVIEVIPNGPAEKAGIKIADKLVEINGKLVEGYDLDEIANQILGEAGTNLTLTIERGTEKIYITLTRERINLPLVTLKVENDIGIIRISSFGENIDQEMLAISDQIIENINIKKLIIDLRANGGGVLDSVIDTSSYFLDPNLVVAKEISKQDITEDKTKTKELSLKNYPLLVLVDKNTASASEILAAALREHKKVQLVGQKTYGKGLVQQVFKLQNGAFLKLTIAEWLTPKGNKINKEGLLPDITIAQSEDSLETILTKYDWETQSLNEIIS